jgi:hypothetical protein
MKLRKMSVLNDDGIPLNLSTVFILFLMPNFILIILTPINAYLVYISQNHAELNRLLGKLANFFAKGALDRIIRSIIRRFQMRKRQLEEQIPIAQRDSFNMRKSPFSSKTSPTSNFNFDFENKYDVNYLFLVPFQIDLLFTVFLYTILTRDVYIETCQSYLTTYDNRQNQVVCWLKNINSSASDLSINLTLHQYCANQPITYINYEHNDVICVQYFFKLINIIDTVTNLFAWHQAIVFVVTKFVVFSYWYQDKLRRTSCWSNLFNNQRRSISFIAICSVLFIYIFLFVLILPIRFILFEQRRVDLTHHLLYACSKFVMAIIVHVNLYTLYQWHTLIITQKHPVFIINQQRKVDCIRPAESFMSIGNSEYGSPAASTMMMDDYLSIPSKKYLTPQVSI